MNEDDIWNKYNRKSKTTLVESELECQELSYSYPSNSKVVFKDISLRTCKDELVAIVGPSGTGKSTFLRVLGNLIPPTHGKIFLNGREVNTPSSDIALIHQSIATFPWMTALDNIKLALKCRKVDADEATQVSLKMLDLVGLTGFENAYPKEMSGGMRQRIAIARALAASPSILLMDEPFVHLDELTANSLRREIYSIVFNPQTTLKSTILVSHNLNEVVQLADRVYVMNGTPATLVDEMNIEMDRPRSQKDPLFWNYVDRLYSGLKITES
ncbi:MAG: ABC transporter ATP-binding protein [Candidatus Nitrosopolaris sp.]